MTCATAIDKTTGEYARWIQKLSERNLEEVDGAFFRDYRSVRGKSFDVSKFVLVLVSFHPVHAYTNPRIFLGLS